MKRSFRTVSSYICPNSSKIGLRSFSSRFLGIWPTNNLMASWSFMGTVTELCCWCACWWWWWWEDGWCWGECVWGGGIDIGCRWWCAWSVRWWWSRRPFCRTVAIFRTGVPTAIPFAAVFVSLLCRYFQSKVTAVERKNVFVQQEAYRSRSIWRTLVGIIPVTEAYRSSGSWCRIVRIIPVTGFSSEEVNGKRFQKSTDIEKRVKVRIHTWATKTQEDNGYPSYVEVVS